jgi:preprotein translocase subunit SecY
MSASNVNYSKEQENVGRGFYLVLVAGWLVTITGAIWTFIDFFNPLEDLGKYFQENIGYLIVGIFGIFLFVFFLMVFFVGFYKKGKQILLKILYTKKELEERYKDNLSIKITAGGVIISIAGLLVGILTIFISEALPGAQSTVLISILSLICTSIGTIILSIGLLIFLSVGIILLCVFCVRNGYYLIAKAIYKLSE